MDFGCTTYKINGLKVISLWDFSGIIAFALDQSTTSPVNGANEICYGPLRHVQPFLMQCDIFLLHIFGGRGLFLMRLQKSSLRICPVRIWSVDLEFFLKSRRTCRDMSESDYGCSC